MFKFIKMHIPDIVLIEPQVLADTRGEFLEFFKMSEFQTQGISVNWAQTIYSKSRKNVLRGLHYQLPPQSQAKLVSVVSGEIFDVAVDIRRRSPTYGKFVSERLSGTNKKMFFIPEGFAHGFCVLSDEAEVIYHLSSEYVPELERNILWSDPTIAIPWPINNPLLSQKDSKGPSLAEANIK